MLPIVEALRRSRLCEGLSDEALARVADCTTEFIISPGELACVQNEPVSRVLIVGSGRLKALATDTDGREQVVGYFEAGDHFGEIALAGTGRYAATGLAVAGTHLLAISADHWQQLLADMPDLVRNVIRSLGGRLKDAYGLTSRETRGRATAVVTFSPRGQSLWRIVRSALEASGERVMNLGSTNVEAVAGDAVQSLRALRNEHDRVVAELKADQLATSSAGWLAECTDVLWLVEPRDVEAARRLLRQMLADNPSLAQPLQLVWVLSDQEQVAPGDEIALNLKHPPIIVELAEEPERPTRRQRQAVGRLVRRLRRIKLGIAFAGGGARGMSHLGVLRALERAGIEFDLMAGTSCGAMAGIVYAAGHDADYCIQSFARDLAPSAPFSWMPRGKNWYLLYRFRTRTFDRMLRPYLHDWTLEQLPIPFTAMAVDLIRGCEVARERGDAVHAILESINLPIMANPIRRDGMILIDGGILNNLPADVLRRKGCDLVVGVSVSTKLRDEFAGSRPGTPTEKMRKASGLETFFRVADLQARGISAIHARSADLMIEPDTSPFDFADFTQAPALADAGEAATEQVLARLKSLLADVERRASATLRTR